MSMDATNEAIKIRLPGPTGEMGAARGTAFDKVKFFRLGISQTVIGSLFIRPEVTGHAELGLNGSVQSFLKDYVLGKAKVPWKCNQQPVPSKDGRTHLSLHGDCPCYIVIELDAGIDWAFAEKSTPFSTIDWESIKEIFFEPTLCWEEAGQFSAQTVTSLSSGNRIAKTRWAYFAFDRDKVPEPVKDDFAFGFNIHVGLYPEAGSTRPILITIDPDVGHPGGQGA